MGKMKARLLEILGGSELDKMIGSKIETALQESATGSTRTSAEEDRGWRRITGKSDTKNFSIYDQHKMQKICYWLYDRNPIAHRIVERTKDFVVGEGISFFSPDPKVQALLTRHWEDPQNLWDVKQAQKIGELGIYGEQMYPAFTADDGLVRLGYTDPTLVDNVVSAPENAEKRLAYRKMKSTSSNEKWYKIVNIDLNPLSKSYGYLVGEAFFFQINFVSNMPRGRSDIFTVADSIDVFEQFSFNMAERSEIGSRVIYDLLMKGATDNQILERLKKFKALRANEIYAHNEKEELNFKVPDLKPQDFRGTIDLLFNHVMGGAGFPPHWFAWAGGVVRATAMAMDLPTKKQLKSRQKVFKNMVALIFRYQIHQAILKGALPKESKDAKVIINLPKIEEKDTQIVSQALVNVTNSLSIGVEEGWVSENEAKEIYRSILSQLGKELDPGVRAESQEVIDKKIEDSIKKAQENLDRKRQDYKKSKATGFMSNSEDDDGTDE